MNEILLFQLDKDGLWTVSPELRKKMNLQALQTRLLTDITQFTRSHDRYAFSGQFNNIIGVTNELPYRVKEYCDRRSIAEMDAQLCNDIRSPVTEWGHNLGRWNLQNSRHLDESKSSNDAIG